MRFSENYNLILHCDIYPPTQHYDWDEKTRALILSSFFWGYVVTQIPAGQIAQQYGAKMLLLGSMIVNSILTVLTPLCAAIGGWQVYAFTSNYATLSIDMFPYFSVNLCDSSDRGPVPRCDVSIDARPTIEVGTGGGTRTIRHILLFRRAIWHRHYVV